MSRYQQTARLANDLAGEMERGVRNPGNLWYFGCWLKRQDWWLPGFGVSDIKPYDLTLRRQAEYAIEHLTADGLRRQTSELMDSVESFNRG